MLKAVISDYLENHQSGLYPVVEKTGYSVGETLELGNPHLQAERFEFFIDDHDACAVIAYDCGLWKIPNGALRELVDGEYGEVWVTYDNNPFLNAAIYERVK